jgi:hypothetical protein
MYDCLRCSFQAKQKNDLRRHLKRKKLCETTVCNISRQKCLDLLENNTDVSNEFLKEQLKGKNDEISILKQELEKYKKPDLNIEGNNNNVTINNGNVYNIINLNPYEKTNYDVLIDDFVNYLKNQDPKLKVPVFEGLIEKIHFNDDYPENHNIYKSNKAKDEYYILDKDGEFKMSTSPEIPREIIEKITKVIEDNVGNGRIQKLIKEHKKLLSDDQYVDETKKSIDTVFYNGRNKVKTTHKKLKKKKELTL